MFELERKFRLKQQDYEQIVSELTQQFGEGGVSQQTDRLFLEGSGFDERKRGQPLLRVRDQNGRYIFTYKRTVLDTGNRIEHETEVADPEAVVAIAGELGWKEAITISKKRLEFHAPIFTYAVDIVDKIGTFIEIEYLSPVDDPGAEAKLFAEAKRLGIDPASQFEPKNYGVLVWEASQL